MCVPSFKFVLLVFLILCLPRRKIKYDKECTMIYNFGNIGNSKEMFLFKIWSVNRQEKYFVLVKVNTNIYQDVIAQDPLYRYLLHINWESHFLKNLCFFKSQLLNRSYFMFNKIVYGETRKPASAKLKKPIDRIVLEKDGTLVDDEEILVLLKDETLIALSNGERWLSLEETIIVTPIIPPIASTPPPITHTSISSNNNNNNNNNTVVGSSTASACTPPPLLSIPPPMVPAITEATVSIPDVSELGLKKDNYDVSYETTRVIKSDISNNFDTSNINSDSFYTSDDINTRQSDIFENASTTQERNMEFTWSKFQIPWEKIPTHMIVACEEGKKNKQIITEIIHIIVNEMRQIKTNIPVKAFKLIAIKLAERFPYAFRDSDEDGVVIGDGTHSTTMKLLDRNNYLNRGRRKRTANFAGTRRDHRTLRSARIGCFNWEPNQTSSAEDLQTSLKSMDAGDENFFRFLNETYADQRKFFNNVNDPPSIFDMKEEWPAILTTTGIFWHFATLTSIDLNDIIKNIVEKSNKLIKFGIRKKLIEAKDIQEDKELTSLEIISIYFKEDFMSIFKSYTGIDKRSIPTEDLLPIPSVVKFENTDESGYVVFLERVPINDSTYITFVDAFAVSYALYFITNLQYSQEICFTMEMVQRYYCKIHPDTGSKSRKKIGAKAKVLTLINKLHQSMS